MDLTRCAALFLVISVHFFLHTGFYEQPMVGKRMLLMTVLRTACMVCVPLFLVLSGYLTGRKKLNRGYYVAIFPVLATYFLASLACLLHKIYGMGIEISFLGGISRLFNFTAANYAWYVEMYLGLFLLIPFLNILYQNIGSKRHKQVLLLTFLCLTAFPSVVNIFNFTLPGWWAAPASSTEFQQLLPAWWDRIYPITYYFFGCYLWEFPIKLRKSVTLLLLLAAALLFGGFNYYRSYGGPFLRAPYQSWGALPTVILTVLLFVLLATLRTERWPNWCKKSLKALSGLCFGGYLLSYIFDQIFYPTLNAAVAEMPLRLNYFPLIVPLVFLCSLALSGILELIIFGVQALWRKAFHK